MAKITMTYEEMEEYFHAHYRKVGGPGSSFVHPSFFDTVTYGRMRGGSPVQPWIVEWEDGPVLVGCYRVVERRDSFLGGEESRDYIGEALTDPTWKDLVVEAERMIRATNDHHHCFLEGVSVTASDTERLASVDEAVVLDLTLVMGS
tara:strand:- start:418 stop:858 length:441 start_codon:yes stop_codon:yes gene_type:complete